MAYLLSNICTKNYWNQTTIVEIIIGGWVESFFETQCISAFASEMGRVVWNLVYNFHFKSKSNLNLSKTRFPYSY